MARKHHTAEQTIHQLREAEVGGYGYRRVTALLKAEDSPGQCRR